MSADSSPGTDPRDDAEWAWFADAYRKVPAPAPDAAPLAVTAALHAIGTAAPAAASSLVPVALKWLLGAGIGIGVAATGYSLLKSPSSSAHAPAPDADARALTADSAPIALPAPDRLADTLTPAQQPPAPLQERAPESDAPEAVPSPALAPAPSDTPADTARVEEQMPAPLPAPGSPMANLRSLAEMTGVDFERLRNGLGETGVHEVAVTIDHAVQAGLPYLSLIARTADGVAHAKSPAAVLEDVEHRIGILYEARGALSPDADHEEINVGADAIEAGAQTAQLATVWHAAPNGRAAAGLTTLATLLRSNVPAPDAADAILRSFTANASDSVLFELGTGVAADVTSGVPPLTALHNRMQHISATPDSVPAP